LKNIISVDGLTVGDIYSFLQKKKLDNLRELERKGIKQPKN